MSHAQPTCWLLSAHSEVLCHDATGRLSVQKFARADARALELALPDRHGQGFGPEFLRFLSGDTPASGPAATPDPVIASGPLAGFRIRPGQGRSTVALVRDGRMLRIDPASRAVSFDATEVDVATSFVVLGAGDRRVLRGLLDGAWVRRSTLAHLPAGAISIGWPYRLQVGDAFFDLRHHLPFEGRMLPYRVALFRDGWRLDELCLYRPLVHIAAFGPEAAARLPQILRALSREADYGGQVMVTTDAAPDGLDRDLIRDAFDPTRLAVQHVDAQGPAARMFARHALLDLPQALRFQPVLMLDAAVLVADTLDPLLRTLATSERIAASLEPAARRRAAPFVGLSLVQRAGIDLRGLAGVDGLVLGVPNLVAHAHTLRLARRIVANRISSAANGPDMPWLEQEVLNYVAAAAEPFDTHLLERFLGEPEDTDRVLLRFAMTASGRAALDARLRAGREAALAGQIRAERDGGDPETEDALEEPVGPT